MTKEELIEFLRENLDIRVETSYLYNYSDTDSQKVEVSLWLGDEKISNDYDTVTIDV